MVAAQQSLLVSQQRFRDPDHLPTAVTQLAQKPDGPRPKPDQQTGNAGVLPTGGGRAVQIMTCCAESLALARSSCQDRRESVRSSSSPAAAAHALRRVVCRGCSRITRITRRRTVTNEPSTLNVTSDSSASQPKRAFCHLSPQMLRAQAPAARLREISPGVVVRIGGQRFGPDVLTLTALG